MNKIRFLLPLLLIIFNNTFATPYKVTRNDFWVDLKDGTKIDCTSFMPETQPPEEGFPCILYCHGYGKSKQDIIPSAEYFAQKGFFTFTYSMRGQGLSSGYSNLISRTEMNDLMEIINFIKTYINVDGSNIAISGSSQGGLIPYMACCNGLDVKCIIADLTSPDFASNWIDNGCIKMSLLWSLSYNDNIVRYNPNVKLYRNWILSDKNDKWDSLYRYLPEGRDFGNKVNDNYVPTYFSNSWDDYFFNANAIIKSCTSFINNYKMYIGTVQGHGAEYFGEEDSYHNASIIAWLNKYLLNDETNNDFAKYIYAYSSAPVINSGWIYYQYKSDVYPFQNTVPIKFYFHPENKLLDNPYYGDDAVLFENIVPDSTLTMNEAVNLAFTGENFSRRFWKNEICFDSDTLKYNYNMLGIPEIHLVYSSTADVCQFNFQIWEVCSDGISKFVNSINYTDRKNIPNTIREKDIEGNADGHIFSKGNKIRIVLTNLDTRYGDSFLRSNPFVLPVLKNARNLIYIGFQGGTYLKLPLKELD